MNLHGWARTLRVSGAALCLAGLVVAAPSGGAAAAPDNGVALYQNPSASVSARVEDLLHRMTLAEKIGQMDLIVTGALRDSTNPADGNCRNSGGNNDPLQPSCLDHVLIQNLTRPILAGGTDNPARNTGKGWADWSNTNQHHAIAQS